MNQHLTDAQIRRSLQTLCVEAVITKGIVAMPVMTTFFSYTIGMSFAQIGLSQAVFTVLLMVCNIPTGWLADRFSRVACNIVGDIMCAVGFLLFSQATSFWHVVGCESLLGIGLAFSGGADVALMYAYCQRLDRSYQTLYARVTSWGYVCECTMMLAGGVIGAHHPRIALACSAVTYSAGALLSTTLHEYGERRITDRHPLHDMAVIAHYALRQQRRLAWTIMAFVISRESTHQLVWVLTPLLLLAGVPAQIVGAAWALNLAMAWGASILAERYGDQLNNTTVIGIGALTYTLGALMLSLDVNLVTICFYGGFGFARGWYFATMGPMIQRETPADIQATVMSVAGSVGQLVYIPVTWGFGAVAGHSPQLAVTANLLLFSPLLGVVYVVFYRNKWK